MFFLMSFLSCKDNKDNSLITKKDTLIIHDTVFIRQENEKEEFKTGNKPLRKQQDKKPSYIPPDDGRNNENWNYNRNTLILNDRECYFGKGLGKRYRHRHGWENRQDTSKLSDFNK